MATYPAVSGTVRIGFHWSDGVGHFGSRLFWAGTNGTPSQPDLNAFATAIATAYGVNIASLHASAISLVQVDVLDISSNTGLMGTWTGTKSGSGTSSLPSSCSIDIEAQIAKRYRGGHPVIHLPPPIVTNMVNARQMSATFTGNVLTNWTAFHQAVDAFSSGTVGPGGFSILTGYRPGALPSQVVDWTINSWKVKGTIGTMRKRLTSK